MSVVRGSTLAVCFALSSLLSLAGNNVSSPKQDAVWRQYFNAGAGYCVSYPVRWYKEDAFDGLGLCVKTGIKKHSRASGEIDIGIFSNPSSAQAHTAPVNLTEDFESHVNGLKKFERAERVQILDQHTMEVDGSPALFTKDKYYDPQDRSTWVEEILFLRRDSNLYRLELECKAEQVDRFEPVFSRLVSTFRFDCKQ